MDEARFLPVKEPPFRTGASIEFQLAILTHFGVHLPWLYNNFIQLYVHCGRLKVYSPPPVGDAFSGSLHCPYLRNAVISQGLSHRFYGSDPTRFLVHCLRANFYVQITPDTLFTVDPSSAWRGKALLIVGYDDATSFFRVLRHDFSQKFGPLPIHYDEMFQMLREGVSQPLVLYRFEPNLYDERRTAAGLRLEPRFELNSVRKGFHEYFESFNSSMHYRLFELPLDGPWGCAVYTWLERGLREAIEKVCHEDSIPVVRLRNPIAQSLRLLWEHKQFMVDRLQYMVYSEGLHQFNDCIETSMELSRLAKALLGLSTKGARTTPDGFSTKAIESLAQIESLERKFLSEFLNM